MKTITLKLSVVLFTLLCNSIAFGQCATTANIYSFVYDGKTYEVIKENKNWLDAAACAVERGGILVEINNVAEQNAIYTQLNSNANITNSNTKAPDGGGGSYVWIGGNDLDTEGKWVWNGNNDDESTQFWEGTSNGSAVNGLYSNWGNEPDDWNGQDALALSLNGWPLGVASEWNDVDHTNTLYYVVEHPTILSVGDNFDFNKRIKLYPNPVQGYLTIKTSGIDLHSIVVYNAIGKRIFENKKENLVSKKIDLSNLNNGIYFIKISTKNGKSIIKRVVK
ncbi:putative secreted protein (Por secretion system target) [Lutibacter sp. Hel_I_33_5]|uniref:T9SS type A sorting domain-containing protein n=1 Tax=Lutibacter sp. Hel_I_33_5 TaxID=1566289 RepID=UPI0011A4D9E2|nr:T9SS type A sorting domain-containing protein [Lutibacter sp. Hel_I_33_5]TVZ54905.1 putative secreted protein (Por secretion system target) [Lutibacter sp. Hel_I_33_5]